VAPRKGAFIVNLGDMLERWTNGVFLSTRHRVVSVAGRQRLSMPFFFGARHSLFAAGFVPSDASRVHTAAHRGGFLSCTSLRIVAADASGPPASHRRAKLQLRRGVPAAVLLR
jgi:isopenicillin N synthase-like dioxygenase